MIKTYRLYNLLITGNIGGAELDALLEDKSYAGALYDLRADSVQMKKIYQNPLAMAALGGSVRALEIMGRDVGSNDGIDVSSMVSTCEFLAQAISNEGTRAWLMGDNGSLQKNLASMYSACEKHFTMTYSCDIAGSMDNLLAANEYLAGGTGPGMVFFFGVGTANNMGTVLDLRHPNGEIAGNAYAYKVAVKVVVPGTSTQAYNAVSIDGAQIDVPSSLSPNSNNIIELWQPKS